MLDLTTIKDNFVKELEDAQKGVKNSLAFIVNQLPEKPIVKEGEIFQVLVIGGSVCKSALIKKNGDSLEIIKKEEKAQPIFNTKDQIFEFIEPLIENQVSVLALNFAYPLDPVFENGKLDGIFFHPTKEHKFEGLVGQKVGFELEQYLNSRGKNIKVSVANDTICLLLSGLVDFSWQNLSAGIVGTGTNFAFFTGHNKAINLEAGNFNKLPQSWSGKIIDRSSNKVGTQIFEKEIAGAYLYQHFNLRIEKERANYPRISSTEELSAIAVKNIPQVPEIAKELIQRSADLVSALLAGLAQFKKSNLEVVMEGSLFWKAPGYKIQVEDNFKKLVPGHKINLIQISDSDILGGAKLVA